MPEEHPPTPAEPRPPHNDPLGDNDHAATAGSSPNERPSPPPAAPPPNGTPPAAPRTCPNETCRCENAPDATFCVRCGQPLTDFELPIEGFQGTPEEIERQWFEQVYTGRGDRMLQLTVRSVVMGSVLGAILSLTNLYIGLKTGWGFGVAITACILSYAIWTTFYRIGLARSNMTILENNCMQSCASSAGYSTGGTLVSAIAAYILVNHASIPIWTLMAWVFFLAILGVTMAIPMKRQMINIEQLRFPSGTAAAETLRALHSHGGKGMQSAAALGIAAVIAALVEFWNSGLHLVSKTLARFELGSLLGRLNDLAVSPAWQGRTVEFAWDSIFVAAGAITGMRVCLSMLVGAVLCWMVYVPILQHNGVNTGNGYREVVHWTLWGGAACMVTSGLLSFAFQWRSALRAFADLGQLFKKRSQDDPLAAIETPASWFIAGQLVGTVGLAYLAKSTFGMPYWLTVLAVVMSFALALVACRVCGETDMTPVGAMGKITQLAFGAIRPGQMNVNLMSACVTAGAADSSSDLLTDLKSGYLLGAHPRKQFLAQFSGIFIGTLVSVVAFQALVPDASVLGSDTFPAPSAQVWAAVAHVLAKGLASLGPVKTWSIIIGGLVGILIPLAGKLFPRWQGYMPSAAGLGLAWTFHWYLSVLFFIGAVIGLIVEKGWPRLAKDYTFPVASGVIAGGSLMGVIDIFWEYGGEMWHHLVKQFG